MTNLKSKSIFVFGAVVLAVLCSSFLSPQTSGKKYLTLTTVMTGMTEFTTVIIREDGKVEEVATPKTKLSNNVETEKIKTQLINTLSSQGYELVFVNATQYIFEKK